MKNKRIYYLLITCGTLFFIVAADFGLGTVLNKRSVNFFRIKHNYYHHGLRDSQASLGVWGGIQYPVYTNNLGFRDTAITEVNPDNEKKKVLIIGDSHSEGVGIDYEKCFPSVLQRQRSDLQIFNASAVSYSPRLYYLRTKQLVEQENFIPDRVFAMIDISDIQNEIVYENFIPDTTISGKRKQNTYEFFHRNSFLFFRTKNIISKIRQKKFAKESELFEEYMEESNFEKTFSLYADFFDSFNNKLLVSDPHFHSVGTWMYNEDFNDLFRKGLKNGAENILKLKALCDEYGIKLSLSVHPWKEQIMKADPSDKYVSFWEEFCKENAIDFLNLYPAFIEPKISMVASGGFFIPNDNHWNEAGHRIVAMEMESWIMDGM